MLSAGTACLLCKVLRNNSEPHKVISSYSVLESVKLSIKILVWLITESSGHMHDSSRYALESL